MACYGCKPGSPRQQFGADWQHGAQFRSRRQSGSGCRLEQFHGKGRTLSSFVCVGSLSAITAVGKQKLPGARGCWPEGKPWIGNRSGPRGACARRTVQNRSPSVILRAAAGRPNIASRVLIPGCVPRGKRVLSGATMQRLGSLGAGWRLVNRLHDDSATLSRITSSRSMQFCQTSPFCRPSGSTTGIGNQ